MKATRFKSQKISLSIGLFLIFSGCLIAGPAWSEDYRFFAEGGTWRESHAQFNNKYGSVVVDETYQEIGNMTIASQSSTFPVTKTTLSYSETYKFVTRFFI